jgi:hypothetical protein
MREGQLSVARHLEPARRLAVDLHADGKGGSPPPCSHGGFNGQPELPHVSRPNMRFHSSTVVASRTNHEHRSGGHNVRQTRNPAQSVEAESWR